MPTFLLLNILDFEFVGYKYPDPSLTQKTALHKKGKKLRLYYYLPNATHLYHSTVPKLKTKKEQEIYIAEFNYALQNGYLPRLGADALRKNSYNPKDGRFSIFFKQYFEIYSVNERKKGEKAETNQKGVSRSITKYFENIGIHSITQITDKDIKTWDLSLPYTPKMKGKGFLAPATRNGCRKIFRAFLNTAKEQGYPLQCNPEKMNIHERGKGGDVDTSVDARKVIYPLELIEAVEKCSFSIDTSLAPDMRKIIRFWREVGLRPGEMFNLSEHNIVYENGRPKKLKIIKLLNCPNGNDFSFIPKNKKSFRKIALTDFAIDFIEELLKMFSGIKRYGTHQGKLIEYPFLFVFWNEKEQKFIRNDSQFHDLFNELSNKAMKEFSIQCNVGLIPYDLRRSCNLYLKTVLGFSLEEAAAFLGHSVETNIKHYTLDADLMDINQVQLNKSMLISSKANPEVARLYSSQFKNENSATIINFPQPRPTPPRLESDSLSKEVSSLDSGFIVMKDADEQ